jgi:hypothetical protein
VSTVAAVGLYSSAVMVINYREGGGTSDQHAHHKGYKPLTRR